MPDDQITLTVRNERPVRAADLADLFATLARDYKRTYGGELIVASITAGSIITVFTDALKMASEYTAGVSAIFEFGRSIAKLVENIRQFSKPSSTTDTLANQAFASAEKLFKLAGNAEASVSLEISDRKGQKLSLNVTKSEVKDLRQNIDRAKRTNKSKAIGKSKTPELATRDDIFKFIQGTGDEAIEAIAKLLVSRGQRPLVLDVASELESRGQHAAAKIFRDAARQIPPTTSLLLK